MNNPMNVSSQRTTGAPPARPVAARPAPHAVQPNQSHHLGSTGAGSEAPGGPDRTAQLARFDGFADALRERVALAEQAMESGDASLLKEASEWLEHGLERLRSGFAEGSLDPADMERGVANLFSGAARIMADRGGPARLKSTDVASEEAAPGVAVDASPADVRDAVSPEGASADQSADMAAAMRERMENLVDHVLGRAEAAGYPDEQRGAAAAEATALFEQVAGRLDAAVFEPGDGAPLDRAQLAGFFERSFSALQGQILALLGDSPGSDGTPATTYGPGAGAEAMSTPRGQVDFRG